jgi:hypothetical protein
MDFVRACVRVSARVISRLCESVMCMAPNGRIIIKPLIEKIRNEAVVVYSRYHPGIRLWGLRKTSKLLSVRPVS